MGVAEDRALVGITEELTTVTWVEGWKKENGEKYEDELLTHTLRRVREVLELRSIHAQLLLLLSKNELQEMRAERIWEPFEHLSPLHYAQGGCPGPLGEFY